MVQRDRQPLWSAGSKTGPAHWVKDLVLLQPQRQRSKDESKDTSSARAKLRDRKGWEFPCGSVG